MAIRISWFAISLLVVLSASLRAAERPNIILFIADDVSWNDYGCYGNEYARTPNIDALAANGLKFNNAYLTASSCSPSRASIVTGRYPHNNGKAAELHLPIAANLPWFPELLRKSGYYTALSGKNHMTVAGGKNVRDQAFDLIDGGRIPGNSGGHGNWVKLVKDRPKDKPFMFWFAAYDAHRGWDADKQWNSDKYGPAHRAESVSVPPFLVDDQKTRADLASYYNEVTRFDFYIGEVVKELQTQGELDNTLIFVLADNGRPFPRAKTRLHDSGMQTALVAHWPAGITTAGDVDSLVSVIDIAPTALSAANIAAPKTMQGVSLQVIFGDRSATVREYAFSEHNWHDYEAHGRSIRDGQFIYVRNNRPYAAWQGPADSVRSASHLALQQARDSKTLTAAQADVFLSPRPAEELYRKSDKHQLENLAGDAHYREELMRLRRLLKQWSLDTADTVPAKISADYFDRETGERLPIKNEAYRNTTPGEDKEAHLVNKPGPR